MYFYFSGTFTCNGVFSILLQLNLMSTSAQLVSQLVENVNNRETLCGINKEHLMTLLIHEYFTHSLQ